MLTYQSDFSDHDNNYSKGGDLERQSWWSTCVAGHCRRLSGEPSISAAWKSKVCRPILSPVRWWIPSSFVLALLAYQCFEGKGDRCSVRRQSETVSATSEDLSSDVVQDGNTCRGLRCEWLISYQYLTARQHRLTL